MQRFAWDISRSTVRRTIASCSQRAEASSATCKSHLDADKGVCAIVHQTFLFAFVNAHDPEEQVAGRAEGQLGWGLNDGLARLHDIGALDLGAIQPLVPVRRQPDLRQGPSLCEDILGIEHDTVVRSESPVLDWAGRLQGKRYWMYVTADACSPKFT